MASGNHSPKAAHVAEAAVMLLVWLLPLSLGSAPSWVLHPLFALSAVAATAAVLSRHWAAEPVPVSFLVWVPLAGAALCALQLIPLPALLLRFVSPYGAEVRAYALEAPGLGASGPVSLDPPGTWRELVKHVSYALVLLTTALLSEARKRRRRLLLAFGLSGVAVSLLGLGHLLIDSELLLGVYRFTTPLSFVTTFGNPNHQAGYGLLCATVLLGLALTATERPHAWMLGGAYVVAGAGVLLSLSRGGTVFFIVGQLLVGLWALLDRKPSSHDPPGRARGQRRVLAVALALVCVLSVSGYIAYERIADELSTATSVEELSESKVDTWPMFARAAKRFVLTGMGRGAFEPAFTRFQELYPSVRFTHPENFVLQLATELGVLGTLLLLALGALGLRRVLRTDHLGALDASLLAGGLALLLHNLFDFNLELPATAVGLALVAGVVGRRRENEGAKPGLVLQLTPLRAAAVLGGVTVLSAVGLWGSRETVREAEVQLVEHYQRAKEAKAVEAFAKSLIARHPAASLLYSVTGRAHATLADGSARSALMLINRALFLYPLDAEAHRAAARTLLRTGQRSQAFLEYRLAYEAGAPRHLILAEAVPRATSVEELAKLAPADPKVQTEIAYRLRSLERTADAEALLRWGIDNGAGKERAMLHFLLAQLTQSRDAEQAWAELQKGEALDPDSPELPLPKANLLRLRGEREEAAAVLEAAAIKAPANLVLWIHLADHLMQMGKGRAALDALKRANPFVQSPAQRSELLFWEGNVHRYDGRFASALDAFKSAARLSPDRPNLHYAIADLYLSMGRLDDARDAIAQGARAEGGEAPGAKVRLEQLHEREAKLLRELQLRQQETNQHAPGRAAEADARGVTE